MGNSPVTVMSGGNVFCINNVNLKKIHTIAYPVVVIQNQTGNRGSAGNSIQSSISENSLPCHTPEINNQLIADHVWIYWTAPVRGVQNVPAC